MSGWSYEETRLRVLVSFEERHNVYKEALSAAIAASRPHVLVRGCCAEDLEQTIAAFDPHAVVSGGPNEVDPGERPAWIEIALRTWEPSELCLAGDCSEEINPGLERVLSVVDEVDSLIAVGRRPDGC